MTIVNELTPELILHEFSVIDVPNSKIVTIFKGGDMSAVERVTKILGRYITGLFTFKKIAQVR